MIPKFPYFIFFLFTHFTKYLTPFGSIFFKKLILFLLFLYSVYVQFSKVSINFFLECLRSNSIPKDRPYSSNCFLVFLLKSTFSTKGSGSVRNPSLLNICLNNEITYPTIIILSLKFKLIFQFVCSFLYCSLSNCNSFCVFCTFSCFLCS